MEGVVKFYNSEKGFGFIFNKDMESDVYFHINDWKNGSVPNGNDNVQFDLSKSQNGKSKAINITLIKSAEQKRKENLEKNDERVVCPGCGKKIVPRIITYRGEPQKSVCPYCATEVKKFTNCFIATAVYQDTYHQNVVLLRKFRDKYLLTNKFGIKFVDVYYKYSPRYAEFIRNKNIFIYPIRKILDGFVFFVRKFLNKND